MPTLNAQVSPCFSVEYNQQLNAAYPDLGTMEDFEEWLKESMDNSEASTEGEVLTIPVVFHIIHDNEEIGVGENLNAELIYAQIEQLNNDFRSVFGTTGYSSHEKAADTEIEFCLAVVNPDGKVLDEPGIDRINALADPNYSKPYIVGHFDGPFVGEIEHIIKPATVWDEDQYLNIWVLELHPWVSGYAAFPKQSGLLGLDVSGLAESDGICIDPRTVGSTELGNPLSTIALSARYGRVLTHEVGHFLGLRHIWGDYNSAMLTPEDVSYCEIDDYCEDTPRTGGPFDGLCPSNAPSCYAETKAMVENYMDYTTDLCKNIFTEDQKLRMRTVLANSPQRKTLVNSTVCNSDCENARDVWVTGETKWTANNIPNNGSFKNVYVGSGAHLTIEEGATIFFGTGNHMLLYGNAKVNLKGTLTSCSEWWGGVKIFDNAEFIGYPNSTISNAKRGLSNEAWGGNWFGPGTISCNQTSFLNNEISVSLESNSLNTNYSATFDECDFSKTSDFLFDNMWYFVGLRNVNLGTSPNFIDCSFVNQTPNQNNENNSGIYAIDSKFFVDATSFNGSIFDGLEIGVQAHSLKEGFPYYVANTTFENCAYGVYSSGVNNATVYNNQFRLGHLPEAYWYSVRHNQKRQVGLAMEGGGTGVSGIFVQNNDFFEHGKKNVQYTIGSKMVELGAADNAIRNNTYTKLNFGNMAHYTNGSTGLEPSGLLYQCNDNLDDWYTNIRFDFLAYSPYGGNPAVINPNQRTKHPTNPNLFTPAYNTFAQHPRWDFYKLGNTVNYYYNIDDMTPTSIEKPREGRFYGINLVAENSSELHCLPQAPKLVWTTAEKTVNRVNYFLNKEAYDIAKAEEQAAKLVANEALIAEKQADVQRYAAEKWHYAHTGYLAAMNEQVNYSKDSVKTWLNRINSYESDLKLAQMAWAEGDWTTVQSKLSTASSKFELSDEALIDLSKLEEIYGYLETTTIDNLSNDVVQKLKDIATPDEGRAAGMARNILRAKGEYYAPIAVDLTDLEAEVADRSSKISHVTHSSAPVTTLIAYPNPADYLVEFDLGLGSLNKGGVVVVTTATGIEVAKLYANEGETLIAWDTHAISNGLYFCHLQIDGKVIQSTKLVIRK